MEYCAPPLLYVWLHYINIYNLSSEEERRDTTADRTSEEMIDNNV